MSFIYIHPSSVSLFHSFINVKGKRFKTVEKQPNIPIHGCCHRSCVRVSINVYKTIILIWNRYPIMDF